MTLPAARAARTATLTAGLGMTSSCVGGRKERCDWARHDFSRSEASVRPAGDRVTSLLVQRSHQETRSEQCIPWEELHEGPKRDASSACNSSIPCFGACLR